jgi:hypothetical protein
VAPLLAVVPCWAPSSGLVASSMPSANFRWDLAAPSRLSANFRWAMSNLLAGPTGVGHFFPFGSCLAQLSSFAFYSTRIARFSKRTKRYPCSCLPAGMVAPGVLADLLVIDGNPLEDIRVLTTPERTLKLIMKGGRIFKNEL